MEKSRESGKKERRETESVYEDNRRHRRERNKETKR